MQIFSPYAWALEIDSADIIFTGRTAPPELLYHRTDGGLGSIVCSIVGYERNHQFYPVYCLNGSFPGAETTPYTVHISEYLDNEKVWRIVTNGFPYNNMGLSDDDAYLVTKIAIYCVTGNADFSRYTYDESRPVTVQTYQALKNLVEVVAEDTTIQKQMGTITIQQVGVLKEWEDNYIQEFSVSSKLEEESFEIKNLSDFPNETFVANLQNQAQTVFLPGEHFKIVIPKAGFTKDINGSFDVVGKVKNYPIFYGEAPVGYQNYTVTFDCFGEELAKGKFKIPCNTGSLRIVKIDADTKEGLAGVTFDLKKEETNEVQPAVTNEEGVIIWEHLYPGTYTVTETSTQEAYQINEEPILVLVEYNQQTELKLENEKKKGSIKIVKQDQENSEIKLSHVKFELYDGQMNLLETLETDENGEAFSQVYPCIHQKYYLKEVETVEGYILNEEMQEIELKEENILEIVMKNARIPKEPEVITIVEESEPQIIIIQKEPRVILKEIEPEPIYEQVMIGEPKVITEVIKLPKTGL